jgi:hypothetical protein
LSSHVSPTPSQTRLAARTKEDDRVRVVKVRRSRMTLAALAADVVDLSVHERACHAAAPERERVLDDVRGPEPTSTRHSSAARAEQAGGARTCRRSENS